MRKLSFKNLFWGTVGIIACFGGFAIMSIAPQTRNLISEFSCETTYILFLVEVVIGAIGGCLAFLGAHTSIYQLTGVSLYREYVRYIEVPETKRIGNK